MKPLAVGLLLWGAAWAGASWLYLSHRHAQLQPAPRAHASRPPAAPVRPEDFHR